MKILFKKLKKVNKFYLAFFLITTIAYAVSLYFLIKNLLVLSGIETTLRIIFIVIFTIILGIYFIWNLINIILKKNKTFIVTSLIALIFAIIFSFGALTIHYVYGKIDNISEKENIVYTTYLIALKDTKLTKESKLGMLDDTTNVEWNILPKELIKKKKLKNEIINYDDSFIMLHALYNKEVDAIFVSSNYLTLFGSEDQYENIGNETYIIYEHSKEMKNQDLSLTSTQTLDEPFTMLLMGVDSKDNGLNANAAFNGDTLMLITFNPHTLTSTIFSIPRDTYVPITCNKNKYAKINSAAAYGTSCVIDTIEQFTDIKIDYYTKINFKGVVDLVEALDGIDVEVTKEFCEQNSDRSFRKEDLICLEKGFQHLNGEQTLAYARHRKTLLRSDIDRTKNQQLIIEAMAKKIMQVNKFEDFEKILNAVSNNIATNMNQKQILSSYNILKKMLSNSLNGKEFIKIQKTYLEYYTINVYTSNMYTSAIGHYEGSLEAIKKAMKVNLELEKKDTIKTFKYSLNEEYESKVIGQGITSGEQLKLVPSFIGKTAASVKEWGLNNNIEVNIEGNENNIVNYQSIHEGVLVKTINSITIKTVQQTNNPIKEEKPIEENPDIDQTIKDFLS